MKRVLHLVSLIALAAAVPACVVRGSGTVGVEGTTTVYSEPPPPQVETVEARPGFVFVRGHYVWRNGQWTWTGGHWERQRAGYAWSEGRWERRGNAWVWMDGNWTVSSTPVVDNTNASGGVTVTTGTPTNTWNPPPPNNSGASGGVTVTVGAYPTAAPPPPQNENVQPRAGFVWITGRWDWRGGRWDWVAGHWERERANQMWVSGSWQLQGGRYVWVEGRWQAGAPANNGPVIRDHRH
jgi:hypothetical protein